MKTAKKWFILKDKTGRGYSAKVTADDLLAGTLNEEINWNGDPLSDWIETAEEMDEFENATIKIIKL